MDLHKGKAAKAVNTDTYSQHISPCGSLIQNVRNSHGAASRYQTELERIMAVIAKLQSWIRGPPAQPSSIVTTKFFRPLTIKILEINHLHDQYRGLRGRNASDLNQLDSLIPQDHQTQAEMVNDLATTSLRHLNETSSFVVSPLVEKLRGLHMLVRSGTSGPGLQKGLPEAVATELDRLRFHADIVEGWTVAFETFWTAGGGAVDDLEKRM